MPIERLIAFYHDLTPDSVADLVDLYSADAYFKDPFNEVRGVDAIRKIFVHMFDQVADPRFLVTDRVVDANGAMLVWEFRFEVKGWGAGRTQLVRGVSHLRFDADGKVNYHRDYWDAAEELYAKLPLIGPVLGLMQRRLSAGAR